MREKVQKADKACQLAFAQLLHTGSQTEQEHKAAHDGGPHSFTEQRKRWIKDSIYCWSVFAQQVDGHHRLSAEENHDQAQREVDKELQGPDQEKHTMQEEIQFLGAAATLSYRQVGPHPGLLETRQNHGGVVGGRGCRRYQEGGPSQSQPLRHVGKAGQCNDCRATSVVKYKTRGVASELADR